MEEISKVLSFMEVKLFICLCVYVFVLNLASLVRFRTHHWIGLFNFRAGQPLEAFVQILVTLVSWLRCFIVLLQVFMLLK